MRWLRCVVAWALIHVVDPACYLGLYNDPVSGCQFCPEGLYPDDLYNPVGCEYCQRGTFTNINIQWFPAQFDYVDGLGRTYKLVFAARYTSFNSQLFPGYQRKDYLHEESFPKSLWFMKVNATDGMWGWGEESNFATLNYIEKFDIKLNTSYTQISAVEALKARYNHQKCYDCPADKYCNKYSYSCSSCTEILQSACNSTHNTVCCSRYVKKK